MDYLFPVLCGKIPSLYHSGAAPAGARYII